MLDPSAYFGRGFRLKWAGVVAGLAGVAIVIAALVSIGPFQASARVTHPDLVRVQRYLNGVQSMHARFLQVSSDGGRASGEIYLNRPGRMRLDYDPPVPVLVVADGTFLIYYDEELQQVSYLPLGSTPADILTRPNIELGGEDLVVTNLAKSDDSIQVTVVQADDPQAGRVTLYFSDNPVSLRKWTVLDAQGVETQVTLVSPEFGVSVDPKLFQFSDPRVTKPIP